MASMRGDIMRRTVVENTEKRIPVRDAKAPRKMDQPETYHEDGVVESIHQEQWGLESMTIPQTGGILSRMGTIPTMLEWTKELLLGISAPLSRHTPPPASGAVAHAGSKYVVEQARDPHGLLGSKFIIS